MPATIVPKDKRRSDYRITIKNARTGRSKTTSVGGDGVTLFRRIGDAINDSHWRSVQKDPTNLAS